MTNNILTNHITLHSHDPNSLMLKSSSQPQLMMNDESTTISSATPRSTPTSMIHTSRMAISKQHHGLDPMMVTALNNGNSNGGGDASGNGGQLVQTSGNEVRNVMLYGIPIVSLLMDGQERLCLAQISNTLLKTFSYNEIHNRRVALGITCVQCTPVQLELLRRAGAMPVSSRRCGMITKREAERLCKSFLAETEPPKLPESFSFDVYHSCAWGCRGSFTPSRYNSSRAKCIKCSYCGLFFSPNKFIFHSHRLPSSKYVQPDAANFNSWRRHIKLVGNPEPADHVIFAWEDVKAMFNGGSRKRAMTSTLNSFTKNQEHHHQQHHHQQQSTNNNGNHHIHHHRGRSSSGVVVGGGKSNGGSATQKNTTKHSITSTTNNTHNSTSFVSDLIDSNNSDDEDLIDDIVGQDSSLDFDVRSGSDGNSIDKSRIQQNNSESDATGTTTPYRFSSLLTANPNELICRPDIVHDHGEHPQHHLHHHQVQIMESSNLQGHCLRTEKSFETLPLPQSTQTIHDSNMASIETFNIHQNNNGDNISAAATSVANTCLSSPSISSPSLSSSVAASSPRSPVPSRPHLKSNPASSLNHIKEIPNESNNTHSTGKDLASKNQQPSIQKMANFPRTPPNVPFSMNACFSPQQQHPLPASTIRQINDLNYVHHHLGASSTSSSSSSSSPLASSLTSSPKFSLGGRPAHHPTSVSTALGGLINSNTAHPAILSSLLAANHQPMVAEHGSTTASSNDSFAARSVSFRTSHYIPTPSTSSTISTTNTNQHHHHHFDRQTSVSTMSYPSLLPPPPPPPPSFPPPSTSTSTAASAAAVSSLMMAAHHTDFPQNLAEFMWNMASRAAAAAVTTDLPEADTPTSNPYANFLWPTLPPPPPPPPPQSLALSPPAHISDSADSGIMVENQNNSAEMELRKALFLHHHQQQQSSLSRAPFPPPSSPYLSPFLPNFLAPNMRFLSHVGSSLNQDNGGTATISDTASKSQSSPHLSNNVEEQSTSSQRMFPFRPTTVTTTSTAQSLSQSSISTATAERSASSVDSSFEIIAARNQFLFDTYHNHMSNLTAAPANSNTSSTMARSTVLNPFLGSSVVSMQKTPPLSFSDSRTSTILKSNLMDPRFSLENNQLQPITINETFHSQSPSLMTFNRKNGYPVNNNHYHSGQPLQPKQPMMTASNDVKVPKLAASNGMKKRSFNSSATSNSKTKKVKQKSTTNNKPIRRLEFSVEQSWDQRTIRKTLKPDDGLMDLSRPISSTNHIRFSNDRSEIGSKIAVEPRQQTKQQSFDYEQPKQPRDDNDGDKQLFLKFKNSEQEGYELVDVDQDQDHKDAASESPTIKDESTMLVVDDDDDDQDGDATIEEQSQP